MENYLEYIDAYFNNAMSKEEAIMFEKKIEEDKVFADEVAFYLSAKQSLREQVNLEKKEHFRRLLAQAKMSAAEPERTRQPGLGDWLRGLFAPQPSVSGAYLSMRRVMVYRLAIAAAVLICVFFAGYLFLFKSASPQQLADSYINEHFQKLGVKMSTKLDSLEDGKRMYNDASYDSAIRQFESIAQRDTAEYEATEYLGKVYLKVGNYDKALLNFQRLEHYSLFSNPAVFLQALTLMKRNQAGDKEKARDLLKQVIDRDLDGKTTAKEWLKRM